jgi:3-oxoisoapionate decarboxylase
MRRRSFLGTLSAASAGLAASFSAARSLLAAPDRKPLRLGLCTFSCHQHWKAAQEGRAFARFHDAPKFYRYARTLGAEGVQASLRGLDDAALRRFRAEVERDGGYFEGEISLPKTDSDADLESFEREVRRLREAGASVTRAVLLGGRRYEVFRDLDAFRRFAERSEQVLRRVEPILRRHRLRLAVENHKDLTAEELAGCLRRLASEWIGVLIDTGNNLALLEDPDAVITTLAPFVHSVHLKDMAVAPCEDGFLLSEVPLGTGALDVPGMLDALSRARADLVLNLEMATRDPLRIPCSTESFYVTFPERRAARHDAMLAWVRRHPPREPVPTVAGMELARVVGDEEANNRRCLAWYRRRSSAA